MAKKTTRAELAKAGYGMPRDYDTRGETTPAAQMRKRLGPEHGGDAGTKPKAKNSAPADTTTTKTTKTTTPGPNENTADDGPPEGGEKKAAELDAWTLKSSPVEYLEKYGKNKPQSKLAQAYVSAGQGDVRAK